MKLHTRRMKHLSLLLAVPLILVACSNEDNTEEAAIEENEVEAENVAEETEEETENNSPTPGKIYDDQDDADEENVSTSENNTEDADEDEVAFEDMTEMEKAYAKAEDKEEKRESERAKLDDDNMVEVADGVEILVDTEPSMEYIKIEPGLENPMRRPNSIDGEYPSEDEMEVKSLSSTLFEHHVNSTAHVSVPVYYTHYQDYVIESMEESEDGESMISVASGTLYAPVDENDDSLYQSYAQFDFSVELEHFEFDTLPLSITINGEKYPFTNTY